MFEERAAVMVKNQTSVRGPEGAASAEIRGPMWDDRVSLLFSINLLASTKKSPKFA